jgi:HD-like signal output (HDOD) protein
MAESSQEERARRIAQRVKEIPTLPAVMTHFFDLIDDPTTTAARLASFISYDQSFTIKILKLANSAFYGLSRKVGTVELALLILGFEEVRNLALTVVVVDTFKGEEFYQILDVNEFWTHSIAVAAGCKVIAGARMLRSPGELFVAGLLHDVGTLVLARDASDDFKNVVEKIKQDKIPQHEAEMALLGFTHADVGWWLAKSWNLPLNQVGAIAHHHNPLASFLQPNPAILLYFANDLAWHGKYTPGLGAGIPGGSKDVYDKLDLRTTDGVEVDWLFYLNLLEKEMISAQEYLSLLRHG